MIIPLHSPRANLSSAGGKGMNLARLARENYPVPRGFILTTEAYATYVEVNDLEPFIHEQLAQTNLADTRELQKASKAIRHRFSAGSMPLILESLLRETYTPYQGTAVAVRSSATAEDLPDTSFAGQQDTFLNVIDYPGLKKAVIDCWSSLWTARAIGYRTRNEIPQHTISLAVVVQEMVEADVSGVLFTANPLNGIRRQMVIDSTFGLGEALVSGQVEPDHFVIDVERDEILERIPGAKASVIRSRSTGGVEKIETGTDQTPSLSDEQLRELIALGKAVESHYRFPQDIEWAFAANRLYLLQSRPVTALYPLPNGPEEPAQVYFSFGAVQGMLDPMTPLGQDTIRMIFAGGASLFGYEFTHTTQRVIHIAGERLWGNFTPILRNSLGRRAAPKVFGVIEPGSSQILERLLADSRFKPESRGVSLRTFRRFLGFLPGNLMRLLRNQISPERSRRSIDRETERYLSRLRIRAHNISGDPETIFRLRVQLFQHIRKAFPKFVPSLGVGALSGLAPYNLIYRMAQGAGVPNEVILELFRGLPHNTTTEMDLALWKTARTIREDRPAQEVFLNLSPQDLSARYFDQRLPQAAQTAVREFLDRYGARGLAEIDFGRPRWREQPAPVMQTLQNYIRIPKRQAPDITFQRGKIISMQALDEILQAVRRTRGGWFRAQIVRMAARRFFAFAGMRESPKFAIIRMMGIFREALLESATDLVMAGTIDRREDIFYLYYEELEALANHKDSSGLRERIAERRGAYRREKRRRQVPRLMLSDGETFYGGAGSAEPVQPGSQLAGSAVSPGIAEGRARVVFDPAKADLQPGEIIVCQGTDPAWTPLFLSAGGLVMEVGGMMTHGSVVAREYGIPAVVGVHEATRIIKSGMKLRVNGSAGTIDILD